MSRDPRAPILARNHIVSSRPFNATFPQTAPEWLARAVVLLCLFTGAAWAEERVVYPDGSGEYPNLQAAINASSDGDIVSLAAGDFVQWAIDPLGKAITIRAQDGPGTVTINGGTVFYIYSGEGPDTVFEGITFLRTAWDDDSSIECTEVSPTFLDCVFQDAPIRLERSGPEFRRCTFLGGDYAINLEGNCPVLVENCRFRKMGLGIGWYRGAGGTIRIADTAFEGCVGGISGEDFIGNLQIERTEFRDNQFGMDIDGTSSAGRFTLTSCVFESNIDFGADIQGRESTVIDCAFRSHQNLGDFGALYVTNGTLDGCLFEGNRARHAGAVYGNRLTVRSCTFQNNQAIGYGEEDGYGGAMILLGGGTSVEECLFASNEGGYGGALCLLDPTTVRDCTFVRNRGYHASVFQLGLSNFEFERIIVFDNRGGPTTDCEPGAGLEISCSDFHGNEAGDWTGCAADWEFANANISSDPLFCDVETGDFSLAAASPCLASNNGCGDMGVFGQGCEPTPVVERSWGWIKGQFAERP